MSTGRILVIVGAVFGFVGVVLLAIAIALGVDTATFLAKANRVDGTVVDMASSTSTSRSNGRTHATTAYRPIVEFTASDGQRHSFRSSFESNPPAYDVGDRLPVAYDPEDPDDARIATFWAAYLAVVVVGGLGIVFSSIGMPLLIIGWRKRRRARPGVDGIMTPLDPSRLTDAG